MRERKSRYYDSPTPVLESPKCWPEVGPSCVHSVGSLFNFAGSSGR